MPWLQKNSYPERKKDQICPSYNQILLNEPYTNDAKKKMKEKERMNIDPLFIKPSDNNAVARVKLVLQYFKALASYVQIAFFVFITFILFIVGIFAA